MMVCCGQFCLGEVGPNTAILLGQDTFCIALYIQDSAGIGGTAIGIDGYRLGEQGICKKMGDGS